MSKTQRKIYRLTLWIYSEDAKIDIDEFHIKRKGEDRIQTEEGETLYSYKLDKTSSGVILGENCIDVSMLIDDLTNIDQSIQIMVEEGKKKIDEQIKDLNDMHRELDHLENYENDILLHTKDKGFFYLKKKDSEIIACPFRIDAESINIKDLNKVS